MMYVLMVILGAAGKLDGTPAIAMHDFSNQAACLAAADQIRKIHDYPKRYSLVMCMPKG
jgi:hypothetical protein